MFRFQVCVLVFGLLVVRPAAAERSATELLDAAIEQFSSGEFSAAAKLLDRAKTQTKEPKILGQIHLYLGVNFEAMKQVAAAKTAFRAALQHDATLALDPGRFKAALVDMFRRIQRRTIGLVVISGRAGATVLIDGQPRGTSPLSVPLPQGVHPLEARDASGAIVYTEEVIVSAGEKAQVVLPALVRRIERQTRPPRQTKTVKLKLRHRRRDADDSWFDWSIWMGLGGVVAIAGVGLGFGVSSKLHEDQALDLNVPHDEARRHHDSATSQATAANIFLVTSGVVAVVVGVWAYVKYKRHQTRTTKLAVGPSGVALRW